MSNFLYPNESGYYYHVNGHGVEEVVYLSWSMGSFWIHKIKQNDSYPLSEDKGKFLNRIQLPSEEEDYKELEETIF